MPHTEGTSADLLSLDRIKCRGTSSGITFQQLTIDRFTAVPMSGSCIAIVAAKGGLYCAQKVLIGYCDFSVNFSLGKHILNGIEFPYRSSTGLGR